MHSFRLGNMQARAGERLGGLCGRNDHQSCGRMTWSARVAVRLTCTVLAASSVHCLRQALCMTPEVRGAGIRLCRWRRPSAGSAAARRASTAARAEGASLAALRSRHRWDLEELLQAVRRCPGTQTLVLMDRPQHPSNVGSVLRQAAVLQPEACADGVCAVLLGGPLEGGGPSERFLKSALRVSLAARQRLPAPPRLVALPPGGDVAEVLRALRREGFFLVGLENREACCDDEAAPPTVALWDGPLGAHDRVLLLAGGEHSGLPRALLGLCDCQCYVPAAPCPLAAGAERRRALGQAGQNPSLNLAHALVLALYERRRQLARRAAPP
mmetsp:Transcript_11825/g.24526  ORF Transcript_11825/g.24526 Transcript_11825/m.24526 type:complete len:327 (-) Transcript_11825:79-1059(-)